MEIKRVAMWDNMKAFLMFLVVWGHYIRMTVYKSGTLGELLYILIFMVIMQGFLFTSGFFSKDTDFCRKRAFRTFLLPYLIFMPFYYFVRYFLGMNPHFNYLTPTMALWFLLTMFYYSLLAGVIKKVPYIVPISLVLGLLIGCIPSVDETLSIGRTVAYMPFFAAGMLMTQEDVYRIRSIKWWKLIPVCLMLITVSLLLVDTVGGRADIWHMRDSYFLYGLTIKEGLLTRLAVYIGSSAAVVLLIKLIPDRETWYTHIGQYTLTVYLGHIFIRYLLKDQGWFRGQEATDYIMVFVLTALSVYVLSRPVFTKIYNKLMNTIYDLITLRFLRKRDEKNV